DVLRAYALEERPVVTVGRLDGLLGLARRTRLALAVGGQRLGLGQSRAKLHFFLHEGPGTALGQRRRVAEEVEEGSGSGALGEGEGVGGVLRAQRHPDGELIDALLVLEIPAAQRRLLKLATNLFDQVHRASDRGERVVRSPQSSVAARLELVELDQAAD